MSPETDRIPVPTNGLRRNPVADEPVPDPPAADQATVVFTPTQMAVGFGILASLVLLVVGRMRRRGRSGRGGFGGR